MPNWCTTDITFYSKNQKQIKELFDCVNQIYNGKSKAKNDFGQGWLGDYGYEIFGKNYDKQDILMRGEIDWIEEEIKTKTSNEDTFYYFGIAETSAWSPAIQLWIKFLEHKKYEEVEIAFSAEEPGMEIFEKFDNSGLDFYAHNYSVYVDLEGDAYKKYGKSIDDSYCLYRSIEAIIDDYNEKLGISLPKDLSKEDLEEKISNIFEKLDENCTFTISEFQEVEFDECS